MNRLESVNLTKFKIWKTLKRTTDFEDADDYCNAINDKGMHYSYLAKSRIDSLDLSMMAAEETEVDLVIPLVAELDLDFEYEATLKDIFARAKERGLTYCPDWVGPELRQQYEEQPEGERLIIFMKEPIIDSEGNFYLLTVEHDYNDDLYLRTNYESKYISHYRPVFVLPRK